jgi:transcription antitermination factor NusG
MRLNLRYSRLAPASIGVTTGFPAVPTLTSVTARYGKLQHLYYGRESRDRKGGSLDFLERGASKIMDVEKLRHAWYALRVRSRHENTVASHLRARGYESFLPLYKSQRRWSDRFKEIELPLFPGYVFCQFNPLNRLPILSVPGIVHMVGVGRTPVAVDEMEIAALQAAVKSGLPRQPWPFVEIGDRVRIEHGPLRGVEGILLGFRGHQRLVLSVTLLQRSMAVHVDEAWVLPMLGERRPFRGPVTSQPRSWQPTA